MRAINFVVVNMNTKQIGEITEAYVLAALLKAGYAVLIPFGDNQRYDMVIEKNGVFQRIQCKTATIKRSCVRFQTSSAYGHRGRAKKDYRDDADLFAAYCIENDKVYIVPVKEVGCNDAWLRLEPTKNGQKNGVRWAKDFELQ